MRTKLLDYPEKNDIPERVVSNVLNSKKTKRAALPGGDFHGQTTFLAIHRCCKCCGVSGDRAEITLEKAAVQELADSLRGNLLLPGNDAYEKARRVLNPSIDKKPALVVQPDGATDIRKAVALAWRSITSRVSMSLRQTVNCGTRTQSKTRISTGVCAVVAVTLG